MKKKQYYYPPRLELTSVKAETGFMSSASIFDEENQHDEGLSTEEHGFADPDKDWEGNYGDSTWD